MSALVRGGLIILAAALSAEAHALSVTPPDITGAEGTQAPLTMVINPGDFVPTSNTCGIESTVFEFVFSISGQDGTANWSNNAGPDVYLTDQNGVVIPVSGQGFSDTVEVCGGTNVDILVSYFVNFASDNNGNEGDEGAVLDFFGLCNGEPCSAVTDVTIIDVPPLPRASISGGSASEASGSGAFTVNLDSVARSDLEITVSASAGSTATNPNDWAFQGSMPDQYVVTIREGQRRGSAPFDIFDDNLTEGNEVINATLQSGSGFRLGAPSSARFTIVDNDMAGISVSPTSIVVSESGGNAQFSVLLDSEPAAPVTVAVSSEDESEGIVDQPSLQFDAGNWDVAQSVTVTGVDDNLDDGTVDFLITVSASSMDPAYASLDPVSVTAINEDNDDAPGIEFTMVPFIVAENVGNAQIEIRRTGAVGSALSANFMTDDDSPETTATAGEDYTAVNVAVTWAAGESEVRVVEIPVFDDTLNEGDETVALILERDGGESPIFNELVIQNDFVEDAIAEIDPESLPQNSRDIAMVILETCPQGNNLPDFQQLCTDVVVEALEGGSVSDALGEIAADSAATVRTPSMDSARVQNVNVSGRLAELRRGATGISFRSFSLNMAGFNINQPMLSGFMNANQYSNNAMPYNPALPLPNYALANTGVGVNNASASNNDSVLNDFGRWGMWVGGRLIYGDKDPTAAEDGYDFNTGGLTFGTDYRFTQSFVAGLAIGYSDNEANLDSSDGGLDSTGLNFTLYGNWFPTENFYLDGSISYGDNSFDQTRRVEYSLPMVGQTVDQTLEADFDGDQFGFTLGTGYDFEKNGWIFGPTLFIEYINVDIDAYDERLTSSGGAPNVQVGWATHIDAQSYESLIPTLGFQVSKALSFDWGVIVPSANVGWSKELEDDGVIVSGYYIGDLNRVPFALVTDDLDGDFFRAGVGLSALFPGAKSAFLTFDGDFDRDLISTYYINAGFRWEF